MSTDGLTESVLRHLYREEGLSDTAIAKKFGTYQVMVNRLRRKYGITTVSRSDRLRLPRLTSRQLSILMGSMLGDGRLFATGSNTAAYSEYHSLDQEPYLLWKASEWGPFIRSIRPALKTENGRDYRGLILRTHGCGRLYPYWRKFYPDGRGNKTFAAAPRKLSALALTIWYLDDGSRTWNGYARFSVSPSKEDQAVCMRLLQDLRLNPKYHENSDGSDPSIWIHDRSSLSRFLDLVAPHVPDCMQYKVDLLNRKRGLAPRDILTESLLTSFVNQGWGASRIAQAVSVSVGSVRRAMDRFGFQRPDQGRPVKSVTAVTIASAKNIIQSSTLSDEDLVDLLVRIPHPDPPSNEAAIRDWDRLKQYSAELSSNVRLGNAGLLLCSHFFRYRYEARYRNLPPLSTAWFDPEWVSKAIRFQKKVGDPVLPMNVHRALRVILRVPTNFRPSVAKSVVEKYCPPGGLVLDPCAGYGGRAAGTLSAGRHYIGVDPHPSAPSAFEGLSSLTGHLEFISSAFEDVSLEIQADLVFTSPPYFSTERYSDDTTQSWVRYATWSQWLRGFLQPFVCKSWSFIRNGGYFVVNTKNLKHNRHVYPIADELHRLAAETGFRFVTQHNLLLGYLGRSSGSEPILVFQKP